MHDTTARAARLVACRPIAVITVLAWTLVGVAAEPSSPQGDGPQQATGIKIGEVTANTAIVWTRLTESRPRAIGEEPTGDPANTPIVGSQGRVRLVYWPEGNEAAKIETAWQTVDAARDFTRQFAFDGLKPATTYRIRSEARSEKGQVASSTVEGRFRTASAKEDAARVVFTVVTGQGFHRRDDATNGHSVYRRMGELDPDFFVHTGDIVYYDKPEPVATSAALARLHWQRMYALPFQRTFHQQTASYFIKDDHDTLKNDCWPGQAAGELTWQQGLAIFREQVPMGPSTYRTVRWGRDLQIWLVEGRDFRSPNRAPDDGTKTIWGREQIDWFKRTVSESDAALRILISPTPLVGPDRTSKNDNHANRGFQREGDMLREFVGRQKDMFVICGDRHWQYVSVDPKSGVREYSCGPTTDKHAGGFSQSNRSDMHQYLNVCGGFLSVTVQRVDDRPTVTFRHHAVDGSITNEDRPSLGE
ncbi:MAG TPA: alkaline phosphatase D family protein [Thermoguttaceae bacterium]|nr:alkaline phosphatase D family protein [Thermoguttaceae bacterium]